MKIGIMTFQETTNYGALLQATALQITLSQLGAESEIIRYRCDEIVKRELPESIFKHGIIHAPISFLAGCVQKRKYKMLEGFKAKYCKISEKEYSSKDISLSQTEYDRFLVGSDIVWELNVTGGDTAFYLDFLDEKSRKYAFSSSFGYNQIPERYVEVSRKLLSDFTSISVRETEGAQIIKELLNQEVPVTADPTLLLTGEQWRQYEQKYPKLREKGYILVYFDDHAGNALSFAKKLANKYSLPIVLIRSSLRNIKSVKTIRDASVEQFLWLVDNAKYVVTGSYHGVLYAINFNTDFYYVNRAHTGRINTIIDKSGITNRNIMEEQIDYDGINWLVVNQTVAAYRNQSISYLKEISRE